MEKSWKIASLEGLQLGSRVWGLGGHNLSAWGEGEETGH